MRIALTVLLGLLFTVAFGAFFLFRSVTGFPMATGEIVGALRDADVRTAALDAVEHAVRTNVEAGQEDGAFVERVLSRVRPAIDEVITDDWFYGAVATAHRGLVDFIEKGTDSANVDLAGTKQRLRDLLLDAGRTAVGACDAADGGEDCYAAARDVDETLERYHAEILTAIDLIPDRANLTWLLAKGDVAPERVSSSSEMAGMRRGLAVMRTAHWIGLAGLVVLLGLVALVNKRSPRRAMVNVGAVVAAASAIYLASVPALGSFARDGATRDVARQRAEATARGEPDFAYRAAERLAAGVIDRTFGRSTVPVAVVLGCGLALLGGGVALHVSRRRRPAPRAPATGLPGPAM